MSHLILSTLLAYVPVLAEVDSSSFGFGPAHCCKLGFLSKIKTRIHIYPKYWDTETPFYTCITKTPLFRYIEHFTSKN